jgi:hypothetical protein
MNFVEAAVALLQDAGKPMHVEELCELALARDLLSKPGKVPLRSMKTRLTAEFKKGGESLVDKVDDDTWQLAGAAAVPAVATKPKRVRSRAKPKAKAKGKVAQTSRAAEAAADAPAEVVAAPAMEDVSEPSVSALVVPEAQGNLEELLAPPQRVLRVGEVAAPEDDDANLVYGDELEGAAVDAPHAEYEDEQTADEDRPMLPEIGARGDRFSRMRDQRREDRERRRRERKPRAERKAEREAAAAANGSASGATSSAARPLAPMTERPRGRRPALPPADVPRHLAPGNLWGDAAVRTLSDIKGNQPVQVKQLAQMMRKRDLLDGDPNTMWPQLKAALLQHERERSAAGLRPDVVYRGRDLFALGAGVTDTADDSGLAEAVLQQTLLARAALTGRVRALSPTGLEQVVQVYLMQKGWTEIEWIKRVGASGYAVALQPGVPGKVLLSVRAGGSPIDRRGIGELRAGVAAKGLRQGVLMSPWPLSDEALEELGKPGSPVHLVCGDEFVDAMWGAGIGVRVRNVPVRYLDGGFWDELSRE